MLRQQSHPPNLWQVSTGQHHCVLSPGSGHICNLLAESARDSALKAGEAGSEELERENPISLLAYPGCPEAVAMLEPDGLREARQAWTEGIVDGSVLQYSSASTAVVFDSM